MRQKKGQVGSLNVLPVVAITFVIAAVVFGVGFEFLDDTITELPNPCPSTHPNYGVNSSGGHGRECANATTGDLSYTPPVTAAFNGTVDFEAGLTKVSNKAPTIGLAIAAGVIIAVIVGFLAIKLRP